jgi:hypothetical protein
VRALYFVRRRPSLGAKLGIPDEFPPNCFPIIPPRNGNIGNGYRDLLESGFKIGENSPMQKKVTGKIFTKIKTILLEHAYFPLLKLKMWFFVQECAAEFRFFSQILSPIRLGAILCAHAILCGPTVGTKVNVLVGTFIFCNL